MSRASHLINPVSTNACIRTPAIAGAPPLADTMAWFARQVRISALASQRYDVPHSPLGLLERKSQG